MNSRSVELEDYSDSNQSVSSDDSELTITKSSAKKRRRALVPSPVQSDSHQNLISFSHSPNTSQINVHSGRSKPARKVNSVWADVVTEQHLTQVISSSVSVQGLRHKKRGPESYNWRKVTATSDSDPDDSGLRSPAKCQNIGESMDNHKSSEVNAECPNVKGEEKSGNIGRSTHNKKRSHYHLHNHRQLCPMKYGVKFEANEEQDPVSLAEKFSNALNEPKADLITRCLRTLGLQTCIRLYEETERIERSGGMLTMDNQRRRYPGGIFLYCLKYDLKITDDQKEQIFGESKREKRTLARARRRSNRTKPLTDQSFKDSLEDLRSLLSKKRNVGESQQRSMDVDEKVWRDKKDVLLEESSPAEHLTEATQEHDETASQLIVRDSGSSSESD